MLTRVKICGITRPQDADAVVAAGADALGLNFARQSPRRLDIDVARPISAQVRGALIRVGLFVDPTPELVARVLEAVELDVLQFHGDESAEFCRSFGLPFMKAIRVREALDIDALEQEYADACCLLLDAYVDGIAGGTGHRFDWDLWPQECRLPLMLAGGLTPENVAEAVQRLRPWAVDVAGGVEGARKGEKDADRIRRFVAEVKRAGSQ
jgi:phosphoribosylanthranilate isomerase